MKKIGENELIPSSAWRIDRKNPFLSITSASLTEGVVTQSQLEQMQSQLHDIVADLIWMNNRGRSNTLPVEETAELLQAAVYTLDIYCLERLDMGESHENIARELCERGGIRRAYDNGIVLLEKLLDQVISRYKTVSEGMLITRVDLYNDTIKNALKKYLSSFHPYLSPHRIDFNVDYPLLIEPEGEHGLRYIDKYLRGLELENRFCALFSPAQIDTLLMGYSRVVRLPINELLENIATIMIFNAAFSLLIGDNDIPKLSLSRSEYAKLCEMLCQDPPDVTWLYEQFLASVAYQDAEVAEYLVGYAGQFARRLNFCVRHHVFRQIAIVCY